MHFASCRHRLSPCGNLIPEISRPDWLFCERQRNARDHAATRKHFHDDLPLSQPTSSAQGSKGVVLLCHSPQSDRVNCETPSEGLTDYY